MQQHSLLATKLNIPPSRPELVSRPRLLERLSAALPAQDDSPQTRDAFSRALTLISAPAGFGKTTLVSEWVQAMGSLAAMDGATPPIAIAWLSLDEGDNDPSRFLAYLLAALRTIEANVAKGMLSEIQSPGVAGATTPPPAEEILTVFINEIAAIPGRIVLVLDDYHLIDAQPIHDALTFLLGHLPQQMHLVIATREDPLLPLARLRAQGQLTELRATDLRFAPSEAAEFLNQAMGLDLSAEDIAVLETRTEGWIAGLQLAALALQGQISMQGHQDTNRLIKAFTGNHRYVLDYLIEEVLEQQSESIQTFLRQTAVLDRLTGPLCDAVRFDGAKSRNGQAILETLERANLFIVPLDEERRWYRYHQLFADLLRQRLHRTRPEWVPTLHQRASEWYEQNGFNDEAIEHALRAESFERAGRLLEEHADAMWTGGEHTKLRRWLAGLPGEVILRKPLLGVLHAWFLYAKGPRDAAEQYLQAAEQMLDASTDRATETMLPEQDQLSDSDRQMVRGRAAVIRALMATYLGNVPAIIEHARQALEYLPKQDLSWRSTAAIALGDAQGFKGDMVAAYQARLEAAEASAAAGTTVFSILAYIKVVITLREQGQLRRCIEVCQQQIQLADKSGLSQGSMAGCLLAIWGEVLAELGDLEGALTRARRGVDVAERGEDWSLFGWSCMCLIRVLFSAGDTAGAQEIFQKLEQADRESILPPWNTNEMAAWQARVWLAQDKLEAASQWAHERRLLAAGQPEPPHEYDFYSLNDHVVLARVLIAQERLDEAGNLLFRLLEAAEAGERTSKAIEIQILRALAFQAGGDTDQAMTALERALTLAEPEGFVRIFVDEGPPMARLLREALSRGIAPNYVQRLLAVFEDATKDQGQLTGEVRSFVVRPSSPTPNSAEGLIEPLSEREVQVLQLIAEGLTNREIAARLFLALNTVKAHTRNIYGKLGVRSRTQAVARARALEILPSV